MQSQNTVRGIILIIILRKGEKNKMKFISEHLGRILVAIAAIALVISIIVLSAAPISAFFNDIFDKSTEKSGHLLGSISHKDAIVESKYYSTFELALTDAAVPTTENADCEKDVAAAAINIYKSGKYEVKLLKDVSMPSGYTIVNGNFIINLNGHTVNLSDQMFRITNGNIVMNGNGGTISVTGTSTLAGLIVGNNTNTEINAEINNLNISVVSTGSARGIQIQGTSDILCNINNCNIEAQGGKKTVRGIQVNSSMPSLSLKMNNCSFKAFETDVSAATSVVAAELCATSTKKLIINNCNFEAEGNTTQIAGISIMNESVGEIELNQCTSKSTSYSTTENSISTALNINENSISSLYSFKSNFEAYGSAYKTRAIQILSSEATNNITFNDCHAKAVSSAQSDHFVCALYNCNNTIVNNGVYEVDNIYKNIDSSNMAVGMAIQNYGEMKLNNVVAKGIQSGVSNFGTMMIDNGHYSSPVHGGVYNSNTLYMQNATLENKTYSGLCTDQSQIINLLPHGVMYTRHADSVTYVDNCVFIRGSAYRELAVAQPSATVYISNCNVPKLRVDGVVGQECTVYIGNNVTYTNAPMNSESGTGIIDDTTYANVSFNFNWLKEQGIM